MSEHPLARLLDRFNRPCGLPAHLGSAVNEMSTGTLHLSVPLLNDIIQVGVAGKLLTSTIEVTKTRSTVMVRRADGKPLQAQILGEIEDGPATRTTVFKDPVDALRLVRVPRVGGAGLWIVTRGGRIRRRPELIQFIQTIIAFGSAKQRRGPATDHGAAKVA